MKHRASFVIAVLLALTGTFLVNRYVFAKPSLADDKKQKWEYCHLYASYRQEGNRYKAQFVTETTPEGRIDEIESSFTGMGALNKLGAEGWELVAIIPAPNGQTEYMLKRPRP